jgi:hypothetical protein
VTRDRFNQKKEKPMRLLSRIGRSLTFVAVLGLTFAAVGCGDSATETTDTPEASTPETSPATDLGTSEAGSDTGGGADVPEAEGESTEG